MAAHYRAAGVNCCTVGASRCVVRHYLAMRYSSAVDHSVVDQKGGYLVYGYHAVDRYWSRQRDGWFVLDYHRAGGRSVD